MACWVSQLGKSCTYLSPDQPGSVRRQLSWGLASVPSPRTPSEHPVKKKNDRRPRGGGPHELESETPPEPERHRKPQAGAKPEIPRTVTLVDAPRQ